MATKVLMEALSPTMEEGRLVEWKKGEGEAVGIGEVLAEVETDKAVMDLVARAEGILLKRLVGDGDTVPVASVIGYIGQAGEEIPAEAEPAVSGEGRREVPDEAREAPPLSTPAPTPDASATMPMPMPATPGRVRASPLARRLARERGLDLAAIAGTGPEGRIIKRDVERTPTVTAQGTARLAPMTGRVTIPRGEPFRDVPLTQIRKTIAKRLSQSLGPVPTFYLTSEVDMERAADARETLRAQFGEEGKVSFNDLVLKAVATALTRHPECNAWWQDDHIRYWNAVHLGMAVAIPDGLITPVIRDADAKSLRELSAEAKDLAQRARERRLTPEEYTGSTFSLSNLGMLDIHEFTAIINPPEAGIIAVGRIAEQPVAYDGQVTVRRRMRLTMSCDHRVIDGATGAEFLRTVKRMLENPLAMVW